MLDALMQALTPLLDAEQQRARAQYGSTYHSAHEGFGVLIEELHEASVELRDLNSAVMEQLLEDLHDNDPSGMICTLADVEMTARRAACECIQVAAVARKLSETLVLQKKEAAAHG